MKTRVRCLFLPVCLLGFVVLLAFMLVADTQPELPGGGPMEGAGYYPGAPYADE